MAICSIHGEYEERLWRRGCPKCANEAKAREELMKSLKQQKEAREQNLRMIEAREKDQKREIEKLQEKDEEEYQKILKKREEELIKKQEEIRKRNLKLGLAAGATAAAAGGAYLATRPQTPPEPSYRKESPYLKYLLMLIIGGIAVFGLYKFGPNIWENIRSNIPEDSDFFVYLNCLWQLFTTGNTKAFNECTASPPSTERGSNVISISLGYGNNQLYTPKADQEYYVPVKITNLITGNPLTVEVDGSLNYKSQSVELIPDPDHEYTTPFKLSSVPLDVTLRSEEKLTCDVKKYDNLTINVKYSGHTESKMVSYLVAEKEEELKSAKTIKPETSLGPFDINIKFSPEKYYMGMSDTKLDLMITLNNKVSSSEAGISRIEIKRPGDPSSKFLSLDKCTCPSFGDSTFGEDMAFPSNLILSSKSETFCRCIYNIGNVNEFLDKDPYKPVSFVVTIYYDLTIKVVSTDSKVLRVEGCSDTTSGTSNTVPAGNYCNYNQQDVEAKLLDVGKNLGIGCPDDILKGISIVESSGMHCENRKVKTGDNGKSIGLMQVNQDECPGKNIYNVYENIECGVKVLKDKYNAYYPYNENGNKNDLHDLSYDGHNCGYSYTDPCERAVRGYNGWNCKDENGQMITGKLRYVCDVYSNLDPPRSVSCPKG